MREPGFWSTARRCWRTPAAPSARRRRWQSSSPPSPRPARATRRFRFTGDMVTPGTSRWSVISEMQSSAKLAKAPARFSAPSLPESCSGPDDLIRVPRPGGRVAATMSAGLAERVLQGDVRAASRLMRQIEDGDPASTQSLRELFPKTGRTYVVGVTGPPGAGKSTLTDRLIAGLRQQGTTVGVLAVDPTSPFTGGAILGDRVRMQTHASDPGVFIRSMATRGHLGGLSRATNDAALVLDAAGKDVIIIETVGVGQDEVDIIRTADISIVTLVPGTGDEVQALKAGIMEIADIFVVNKADREGADRLVSAIESTLGLQIFGADEWRPPILKTIATSGNGVPELVDAIWAFRARAEQTQATRRRARDE